MRGKINKDSFLNLQPTACTHYEEDFKLASEQEKQSFSNKESIPYWKNTYYSLKTNKIAVLSSYIFIAICLFAFLGPLLSQYDYSQQIRGAENLFPSWQHPFGTDNLGRDILVRTMYGTRISLIIGLAASFIVLIIGTIYGAISGYFGGIVDTILMRFAELIYSIPDILIVLLLTITLKQPLQSLFNNSTNEFIKNIAVLGPGLIAIFIAFALLYWVGMARIIRGQVLMLKQREFVIAARVLGASNSQIIKKHLIPNCIGPIIVTTCMQIPTAIFLESFLSFLGLGVSPPMVSLGSMIADALEGIYTYTYRLVIPGIILILLILSLNLFGDGLRDAFDPNLKGNTLK